MTFHKVRKLQLSVEADDVLYGLYYNILDDCMEPLSKFRLETLELQYMSNMDAFFHAHNLLPMHTNLRVLTLPSLFSVSKTSHFDVLCQAELTQLERLEVSHYFMYFDDWHYSTDVYLLGKKLDESFARLPQCCTKLKSLTFHMNGKFNPLFKFRTGLFMETLAKFPDLKHFEGHMNLFEDDTSPYVRDTLTFYTMETFILHRTSAHARGDMIESALRKQRWPSLRVFQVGPAVDGWAEPETTLAFFYHAPLLRHTTLTFSKPLHFHTVMKGLCSKELRYLQVYYTEYKSPKHARTLAQTTLNCPNAYIHYQTKDSCFLYHGVNLHKEGETGSGRITCGGDLSLHQ
jgi:hypothetical protein